MVKRLVEQYQIGDIVEIKISDGMWMTAVVIMQQHPGIWVETLSGNRWFVTNTTHIRPRPSGQVDK